MRRALQLLVDVALIGVATLVALVLRENFEVTPDRLAATAPYFLATLFLSCCIIPILRLNASIWRLSSLPDYLRIGLAMTIVAIGAVAATFVLNRMEGVARSLPFLQIVFGTALLVGIRVLVRLHHTRRQERKVRPLMMVEERPTETVLVVGLSRLTETYLQSIDEFARGRIKIAGLLGHRDRHVGRLVAQHAVLGKPEDIERILSDLEVHGVTIDRIVVTRPFASLDDAARDALLSIERAGAIPLQFLSQDLGFERLGSHRDGRVKYGGQAEPGEPLRFSLSEAELKAIARRPYWQVKRALDVVMAAALLVALSPILLLVSALVAASIGTPVVFWQQRPGVGGWPFRLYKFRSMAAAHRRDGRALSDDERTSLVGVLLRRTRLDELPQLFNILRGDMSFIGPRPLLPRDQSSAHRARLLLRPGLTGWAQVVGGRIISADDKVALDVWYLQNASLWLDLKIIARTVPMVLFGERTYQPLIERAWRDLRAAGVVANVEAERPVRSAA